MKNKKMIFGIGIVLFSLIYLVYGAFIEDTSSILATLPYSTHTWFDYDNDGDYDLFLAGGTGNGVVYLYNNSNGELEFSSNGSIMGIMYGSIGWVDYDNDGYIDLIISGYNGSYVGKIYQNQNNDFADSGISLQGLAYSAFAIGDYNNDGYTDLIEVGCSNYNGNCLSTVVKTYNGTGSGFLEDTNWSRNLAAVWRGSIALGDYNNDGRLDLALSGTNFNNSLGAITKIYRNDGSTFVEDANQSITGLFYGSIAWSDYDNDNDIDLVVSGAQANNSKFTAIYENDQQYYKTNVNPSPPAYVNITFNGSIFNITWINGTDSETNQTALYYNLRVGSNTTNATDRIVSSKYATSSNPTQGYFGNMMQSRMKLLNIPQQCLFVSVQSIDSGLENSSFSSWVTYSSQEICNNHDNDCDFEVDEGYDANNDGYITSNEAFDKDGDNYYPLTTWVYNSSNSSNSTYSCTGYDEYDCDDNNADSYPGASCSRSGFTDSYYQWNSNNLRCDCVGGQTTTNTGSVNSVLSTTTNTPSQDTSNTIVAVPVVKPVQQETSSSNEYSDIIDKILTDRFSYSRKVIVTDSETKIFENIKAIDIFGLEDVNLDISIPKPIEDRASDMIEIDDFNIIQDDPEIKFYIGTINPLKTKEVQYGINKKLSARDIDRIIATINVKNDTNRKDELEKAINETSRYLNVTQDYTINYDKNETEFRIKLDYNESDTVLGDVYIYTEIPKCLVAIIKEELIESDIEFEIVSEDPLIVWHFDSLLDVKEINYNIKAIADEDCANKAKAMAIAKKIVEVKFSPKKSNIFLVLSIIPFIILIMGFFVAFGSEVEHYNPYKKHLIAYIKHHYSQGFKKHHIVEKLKKEGYSEKSIYEALKLNAKGKLHYLIQRLEVGFEEIVLGSLILLNILDFTELLPGDVDYLKKIISWSILAFLLYHVSITKLIFGIRRKWVDITLIMGYFLMILKNMVGFANAAFIETVNNKAIVADLYGYIIQHNRLFEIHLFLIGALLVTATALYISLKEEVKQPSFLSIVHFHPDKSMNPKKMITRFMITWITLLAFFIVIFNLMMEWLAIAVDALILVITLFFIIVIVIKHRKKFTAPKMLYEISETSEKFYEKFINLFHYKKHIMIGLSGLLMLHIWTELGNFLIPYLTGLHDAIYFGNFYENHMPLFNIVASETNNLFAIQSAGLGIGMKAMIAAGYSLNIIGVIYLILLPTYVWYHMFRNRNLGLEHIPRIRMSKLHRFLSVAGISFLFIKPVFSITSIKAKGLIGVDVQTKMFSLDYLGSALLAALLIGIIALIISLKHNNAVKKTILSISLAFFVYYIMLFFSTTASYYVGSIGKLIGEQQIISIYLLVFLLINIFFYISGIFSLFIELYLRKEVWFEGHKIKWVHKLVGHEHHKFHFIHHYDAHKEHIHGSKEEHIQHYLKRGLLHGHSLNGMKQNLLEHGWPKVLVDEAEKEVLRDKYMMKVVRALKKVDKQGKETFINQTSF